MPTWLKTRRPCDRFSIARALVVIAVAASGMQAWAQSATAANAVARPATVVFQDDWLGTPLTDVRSNQSFALRDFGGRIVLLQPMAAWCSVCAQQQRELAAAQAAWDDQVVVVSIDVDPNENAAVLARHANNSNLPWTFAVAPVALQRVLADRFGRNVLNPPTGNLILIDRSGNAQLLRPGVKPADELVRAVAQSQ